MSPPPILWCLRLLLPLQLATLLLALLLVLQLLPLLLLALLLTPLLMVLLPLLLMLLLVPLLPLLLAPLLAPLLALLLPLPQWCSLLIAAVTAVAAIAISVVVLQAVAHHRRFVWVGGRLPGLPLIKVNVDDELPEGGVGGASCGASMKQTVQVVPWTALTCTRSASALSPPSCRGRFSLLR